MTHDSTGHAEGTGTDPASEATDDRSAADRWDDLYRARPQVWSGRENPGLTRRAVLLRPGRALDLGCGEGGDAVWLAARGWWVTGVDVSPLALDRAAAAARAAGVADRISWECLDLATDFPAGSFDLVSAQYLHSFFDLPRREILQAAARAVAPGGTLLIGGHAGTEPLHGHVLPTTAEVLAGLDLPVGGWTVVYDEEFDWAFVDADGRPATRRDNLLELRRSLT